jgi:hypothetical protein
MLKPLILPSDGTPTDFPGARLRYFDSFFTEKEAEAHFNQLLKETPWQQDPITVFGKTYAQPRLTASDDPLTFPNPRAYSSSL